VVWCGVVWCGVVWCGVVWCGVVWQSGCGCIQSDRLCRSLKLAAQLFSGRVGCCIVCETTALICASSMYQPHSFPHVKPSPRPSKPLHSPRSPHPNTPQPTRTGIRSDLTTISAPARWCALRADPAVQRPPEGPAAAAGCSRGPQRGRGGARGRGWCGAGRAGRSWGGSVVGWVGVVGVVGVEFWVWAWLIWI